MKEVWKDIKGYEKLYQVSNLGRVSSLRFSKPKILKTRIKNGYEYINLGIDNKRKTFLVHRLIAETFIENPNPDLYTQVHHINSIRNDNRVENLLWCTQIQNLDFINRNLLHKVISNILRNNPEIVDIPSLLLYLSK
jgi:hypothetical protein